MSLLHDPKRHSAYKTINRTLAAEGCIEDPLERERVAWALYIALRNVGALRIKAQ